MIELAYPQIYCIILPYTHTTNSHMYIYLSQHIALLHLFFLNCRTLWMKPPYSFDTNVLTFLNFVTRDWILDPYIKFSCVRILIYSEELWS